MSRPESLNDPELATVRRRQDAAPDFGLFAVPTVEEATAERDAIIARAEDELADWVRRGRAAMLALYNTRLTTATREHPAYVTAADLADWCDREGFTGDKRKLAGVFVGKGASWMCVGRVPNPRRHSSLTPCWAVRAR